MTNPTVKTLRRWACRLIQTVTLATIVCLHSFAIAEQAADAPNSRSQTHQSGYDQVVEFGGPDGVTSELKRSDEEGAFTYQFDTAQRIFEPYFDWKQRRETNNGLALGLNVWWLYQKASETLADDDQAASGIYRAQGRWTVLGRGTRDTGWLEWRAEKRSNLGSLLAPSDLSSQAGIAALNSGFGYSDKFDADISVLNWTQTFADQRAGFAIGRLDFAAYLDPFAFQTFSRGFMNRAVVINPTLATTGVGALGAVFRSYVTDTIWVGGQLYDGNAASGDFDVDTFEEHEWLKAVEVGWTPSTTRRGTDRVQLTYWSKDARTKANVPRGKGWAVSASWKTAERWLTLLRFGHSDGGAGVAAEDSVSIGFEYTLRPDQALSVAAGWANPSTKTHGADLSDEQVVEVSYRFQLSKNFSLTPDVQVVFNPANNPERDQIWITGIRAYLSF